MTDIVIAAYRRSPFTLANKGALTKVRPDDMTADVVRALVDGIDVSGLEDIIVGCAFPEGEQGMNIARIVGFLAGLPRSVAGTTVNRFCGSSMQAVHQAAGAIALGAGEAFVCAGVESMTRVPTMGFNPMPNPKLAAEYPQAFTAMGDTAENIAQLHQVSRADQDAFAARSQAKAAAARADGRFAAEIVPVGPEAKRVTEDGCIRDATTPESLAGLKPAFRVDGTVTAGTSSPLTDGASAVLVCTAEYARSNGLTPLARIKSVSVSGCQPEVMGMGPVEATRKALARAGLKLADIDVIELNEAFASQAIACIRELGMDEARVNLDGGAIALGHPMGATGARIVGKAASLLRREGGRFRAGDAVHRRRPGHRDRSGSRRMSAAIQRVGVVGAGVMGAGIAAQIANAGVPVVLLDLVAGAAEKAVAALLKTEPAAFMHRRNARLVEAGDLDADFAKLADCDWIVEAIVERPDAKRALYARIGLVRKPGCVVSSNTSTIPLADLLDGASADFASSFMVTHFFNPPRYMRLLEIVPGHARADAVAAISAFADERLGKTVVTCRDTPGFIANRIGTLWISSATRHAIDLGLTVEEADAVAGRPFGVPKTGIFGLMDLVGIDLGPHVAHSLLATLPAGDAYRAVHRDEPMVARMIADGRTGRKGKGGFYTLKREGSERIKTRRRFRDR